MKLFASIFPLLFINRGSLEHSRHVQWEEGGKSKRRDEVAVVIHALPRLTPVVHEQGHYQ